MTNAIIHTNACECIAQMHTAYHWGQGSEWFWVFWQFIAVAASLLLIWWQIRIQTATHVVQTICTLQERWNAEFMQRVRLEVCTKHKNSVSAFDGSSEYIAEFLEELAVFVKTKAVPIKLMWEVQSWNIECYWPMFKQGIEKLRQDYKDDKVYYGFEKLYKDMCAMSKVKGSSAKTPKDIIDFKDREIRSTKACLDIRDKSKTLAFGQ